VPLLEELGGVIHRKKFTQPLTARGLKAEELFNGYAALCRIVEPVQIQRTSIDPDDDAVLAAALAAPADLIVSGDAHLLNLKAYHRIPIITAAEAVNRIAQSSRG
jgi:putative PIN family toxin of toxin-antitoxin system